MAILTIPKENKTIDEPSAIAGYLAGIGVDYEIWEPAASVATDAPAEEILCSIFDRDREAQRKRRLRHSGRDRRQTADARPGRDAGQIQPRALARR